MNLGEGRIEALHSWIKQMCDPDINLCKKLMPNFEEICQTVKEKNFEGGGGHYTHLGTKKVDKMKLASVTGFPQQNQPFDGPVVSRKPDGTVFEGNFKRGTPHGYFRHINSFGDVEFFGCFVRGVVHGVCWRSLPGGGFLVSPDYKFSGSDVVFLYPDCRTALVGDFNKGEMESARRAEVIGASNICSYFCTMMAPMLSPVTGQSMSLDRATPAQFCSSPLLEDPYESIFVEVGLSDIPGAGEGLFARRDIEAGTVIAFYNGLAVKAASEKDDNRFPDEYRILLDSTTDLDMPPEMTDISNYCATLGHKVCHSFQPNAEFDTCYHPRFGLVRCVATLCDIMEGQEITVHYRYPLALAPDWYRVGWAQHQKNVRGLPNWQGALQKGRTATAWELGGRRKPGQSHQDEHHHHHHQGQDEQLAAGLSQLVLSR